MAINWPLVAPTIQQFSGSPPARCVWKEFFRPCCDYWGEGKEFIGSRGWSAGPNKRIRGLIKISPPPLSIDPSRLWSLLCHIYCCTSMREKRASDRLAEVNHCLPPTFKLCRTHKHPPPLIFYMCVCTVHTHNINTLSRLLKESQWKRIYYIRNGTSRQQAKKNKSGKCLKRPVGYQCQYSWRRLFLSQSGQRS
jgi:hypothetical protein